MKRKPSPLESKRTRSDAGLVSCTDSTTDAGLDESASDVENHKEDTGSESEHGEAVDDEENKEGNHACVRHDGELRFPWTAENNKNSVSESGVQSLGGRSKLLGRLREFLPAMERANRELMEQMENGDRSKMLEDSDSDDDDDAEQKAYIEMDLGLGVLEEKKSENEDDEDEDDGRADLLRKLMGQSPEDTKGSHGIEEVG
jgi:hypothetical protein